MFLPIPSVEKYLKSKLVDTPDKNFIKLLGDKYFNQRSLSDIIKDYLMMIERHLQMTKTEKISIRSYALIWIELVYQNQTLLSICQMIFTNMKNLQNLWNR